MSIAQPHLSHPKYRPDIDGLRAIAVLSVVAFHAFPGWLKGGFVGVDVFFVISGYLISTIIFDNLSRGTFSFAEFYARRIKRIFPALLVILAASYALGWAVLLVDEYQQLGKHIAAGAGFVSNFVFWSEAGYFDSAAETKPLLHLWSLGIEEQFYIVWPLLLWLAWKRRFNLLAITALVGAMSFYVNLRSVEMDPVATFYSPLTRSWELLFGSMLAYALLSKKGPLTSGKLILNRWSFFDGYRESSEVVPAPLSTIIAFVGLLLLLYGFSQITEESNFPGRWAMVPVLGAVLLILAGPKAWFNRIILSNKVAVWFGLISFPLYLWHWPLLSFARIVESGTPDTTIRAAAVILSVALAWLTYKFVERPIRLGNHNREKVIALALFMIVVGFAGLKEFLTESNQDFGQTQTDSFVRESRIRCEQHFPDWGSKVGVPCHFQLKAANSIAIIGDSYAQHLLVGMSEQAAPYDGVAVFGASCAAPYIDIATGLRDVKARKYRKEAYKLINGAYEYIIQDPAIKIVLLAHNPACSYEDAIDMSNSGGDNYQEVLVSGMKRTFSALIAAGKKVVVVFENPYLPYDPKLCVTRPFRLTKSDDRCSFPRSVYDRSPASASYRSLVDTVLRDFPQIEVFNLSDTLCDGDSCYISKSGRLLYSDRGHLSWEGSRYVASHLMSDIKIMY
jgi:peptidoglycan/LPS O-acetylase OafA/YrhL